MSSIAGGLFGGDSPQQVGPSVSDIEAASQPYGITTPTGSVAWDYDAKTGTASLTPEMEAIASRLLGRAGTQAEAIGAYDPYGASQQFYKQYVAPDLLQEQEQERLSFENRLLAQGMLDATGGATRMGEMLKAQAASRRGARAESYSQAQQWLDAMRQREIQDIATAGTLYEAPVSLAAIGAGVGQGLGGILASYRPSYEPESSGGILGSAIGMFAGGYGSGMGKSMFASKAAPSSDMALKENIRHEDVVNGINIYSWDWNEKAKEIGVDSQPTVGVLAQEVKQTHPDAVNVGDHGYYTIDYSKLGVH